MIHLNFPSVNCGTNYLSKMFPQRRTAFCVWQKLSNMSFCISLYSIFIASGGQIFPSPSHLQQSEVAEHDSSGRRRRRWRNSATAAAQGVKQKCHARYRCFTRLFLSCVSSFNERSNSEDRKLQPRATNAHSTEHFLLNCCREGFVHPGGQPVVLSCPLFATPAKREVFCYRENSEVHSLAQLSIVRVKYVGYFRI